MALTEEERRWLEQDNFKILLAEIVYHDGGGLKVGYFSNYNYITQYGDSFTSILNQPVSHISYIDNLINIPTISSKLDQDTTVGALEFLNTEGLFDHYITYAWEGYPMRLLIGDPSWRRDQFILILEGINSNISSSKADVLSLSIRDKRDLFNSKIQTNLITEEYVRNLVNNAWINGEFTKPGTNNISPTVKVEVKITPLETNNDITFIQHFIDILDSLPDISAEGLPLLEVIAAPTGYDYLEGTTPYVIKITGTYFGSVNFAHDGSDYPDEYAYDTGFKLRADMGGDITVTGPIVYTSISGTDSTVHEEYIIIPEDIDISSTSDLALLNSKFFHIYTTHNDYCIWFNYNNTGIVPDYFGEEVEWVYFPFLTELVDTGGEVPEELPVVAVPEAILDSPIPLVYGKVFNITPKLIDANNHIYQVHDGEINGITEVRFNGNPLKLSLYEVSNTLGCFRLLVHQNNVEVTCDVEGAFGRVDGSEELGEGYVIPENYSITTLIERIVVERVDGLNASSICPETFGTFYGENAEYFEDTDIVGVYIDSDTDINEIVTNIAATGGAVLQFGSGADCKLQIVRIIDPINETPILYIDDDNIVEKGVLLGTTEPPKYSISLGYMKNWTVQDKAGIAGIISESDDDITVEKFIRYTTETSNYSVSNSDIRDIYPLAVADELVETYFYYLEGAKKEADRRINIRNKKRYTYKFDTTAAPFTLRVGNIIEITHNRFGFQDGKIVQIVGIDEYPTEQRTDLEVWL